MSHPLFSPPETARALAEFEQRIDDLRRPGALAGWDGPVERVETHLSVLLMAGDEVYKLKKPLVFGFVDFSTAALRREACEQELRLNRRTAPRWYLDVVAVREGRRGACVPAPGTTAAGPEVDWAVRMRRFDDRERFDRLAAADDLSAADIDRLAEVVAQFHARLDPAPPGHGRSDAARHWARANLAELAALPGAAAWSADLAALQRWTEAQGASLAGLMDLRCRTGHVREVHGDLHLANIVRAGGLPMLFDALEFDDTLRHTDTLGDLAFCFMDLLAHDRRRLAWRFLNATLDAAGDHAAMPLLRWWAVYRALVRAKVVLLQPSSPGDGDGAAARYLGVARELAGLAGTPPVRPWLVLAMGLSGSGKTVAAGALAERLEGLRLRSDVERKRLFGLPPTARAAPSLGLYGADATRRTYERLQELAGAVLRAGVPVVVDAASLRRAERDAMRALAAELGAGFRLLLCSAPDEVLRERLARRALADDDASDATGEVLDRQLDFTEWPGADEAADLLPLDTDAPWPVVQARIDARAEVLLAEMRR